MLGGAITGLPGTFTVASATTYTTWPTATFAVRVRKTDGSNNELIYISSRSSTTLTVGARGLGGSSTVDHTVDEICTVVETAEFIEYLVQEVIAHQGWSGVLATMVHASVTASSYTALSTDAVIPVDTTSNAVTINLPTAVGIKGRTYFIVKTDSGPNAVTVDGNSTETIGGATTAVLKQKGRFIVIVSDGTNWFLQDNDIPYIPTISTQSGTYTVVAADLGTIVELNGTFTVTLPNTGIAAGFNTTFNNVGSGTITFASSATITGKGGATKLATQYSACTAYWTGTVWRLNGDITT